MPNTAEALTLFNPDLTLGTSPSGIIHACDICGRTGRWTTEWSWYGSVEDQCVLQVCGCVRLSEEEAERLLAAKRCRELTTLEPANVQ